MQGHRAAAVDGISLLRAFTEALTRQKNQIMIDLAPYDDFEAASRAVLAYLHKRLGFGLWMLTRTEGLDWIVLQAEDHGYNVEEGTVFRWADTFCSHMVLGLGPRVASSAQDIPVYAASPIGQQVPIGAYIGVPLVKDDGSLFGTLCAIDPKPQKESIQDELPLIELLARLLGTILAADLKAVEQKRLIERSQQEAMTDVLTGLLNRYGWEKIIAAEESRSRRYASPACIIMVDLDDLKQINDTQGHAQGDALLRNTSQCLKSALRENDIVARIGGDEFAILGIECDSAGSEILFDNVKEALSSKGIKASVGKAIRDPKLGLIEAIAQADQAMYAAKAEYRSSGRS